jgi:hypothetical protein
MSEMIVIVLPSPGSSQSNLRLISGRSMVGNKDAVIDGKKLRMSTTYPPLAQSVFLSDAHSNDATSYPESKPNLYIREWWSCPFVTFGLGASNTVAPPLTAR